MRINLKHLLLILLGFLVAFSAAELILRMLASDWLIHRMKFLAVSRNLSSPNFGTDIGWPMDYKNGKPVRFHPNSQFDVTHYEYRHKVDIDEWGGRRSFSPDQKKDKELIPFFGDSICFGIGVRDEQTYVSLLNQTLKYQLVNLAIPGSSLPVHLDIIEHRHEELGRPRFYVFNVFVGNDLTNIVESKTASIETGPLHRTMQAINRFVFYNRILNQLYVVQFMKSKFLSLYNRYRRAERKQELMDPLFLVIQKNKKDYLNRAGEYLDLEFERLGRLSKSLGFRVFFILLPHRDQVSFELLKSDADYYGMDIDDLDAKAPNQMIKEKLAARRLPYMDTLDCLEKEKKPLYYVQDGHFLPVGHKAVSECALPALKEFLQDDGSGKTPQPVN